MVLYSGQSVFNRIGTMLWKWEETRNSMKMIKIMILTTVVKTVARTRLLFNIGDVTHTRREQV